MKHFERELPANYHAVYSIDATDKKTGILLNLAAFAILLPIIVVLVLTIPPKFEELHPLSLIILAVALIVYLVLHELVHGAAYKLLTGEKLTFGVSFSCAYCGVPHIYVYRGAALISLLAPFVIFTAVFLVLMAVMPNDTYRFLSGILLAIHISGCVGDLYDTLLYLIKLRDPSILMQDTGPKQTFFAPKE